MMGPWEILVLGAIGLMVNWRKYWKAVIVLIIWFLGPIVVQSEYAKVFTARYILFSIPFLVVLAASVFTEEKKKLVLLFAVILVFFVAQALVFDRWLLINPEKANLPRSERSGYLEEWTAGQGIYETSVLIKNEQAANPKEKIIVGTEGYFGTLPDALEAYMNDTPSVIVIGVGLDFSNLPQSLIDSQKFGDKTYLVVNDERYNGNSTKEGLILIAKYPKAIRPGGTRQSLLLFELTDKSIPVKAQKAL
jgi:hypothetical protein